MANFFKFILILLLFIPVALFMTSRKHNTIVGFHADGVVESIEWRSREHGMPIISISENGKLKLFKSNRITLKQNDLKVGDRFRKESGSKLCFINEVSFKCINR